MKITVLSSGSRGDAQPYVALGVGLKAAGYEVTLGLASEYADMVRQQGLNFVPLHIPPHYAGKPLLADCTAALEGADAAIASLYTFAMATPYCRAHHITLLPAFLQTISSRFTLVPFEVNTPKRSPNPQKVDTARFWFVIQKTVNTYCQEQGLPITRPPSNPIEWVTGGYPVLFGFSSAVVPDSEMGAAPGYATGYWFLDLLKHWQPPQGLLDFLDAGPPPIHIGFGSLLSANLAPAEVVVEAIKRTGQRAVMIRNIPDLDPDTLPANVYLIDNVPYEWLLPRCSASVNHGGHGTIAHALQTATPCVTIPTIYDQPYWAHRAYQLGAAVKPLEPSELTVDALSAAIMQAVNDADMKARAVALSEFIRAENGVQKAVELFADLVRK